jgi:dihydrofolate synthase/folylpolyglutamate synthase
MAMDDLTPKKLKTLADATLYLEGLINHERRPGFDYARLDLAAIKALLDALGRPQDSLSILHVAGSKGKGSTCLFAEAILLELGASVGTFTSPHLESWVERFRVDGRSIDEERLVRAVRRVRPFVEALRAGPIETRPSFFDATTAVAIVLFADADVDHAILEVGLGGRLDSTNVVAPVVTCITSIELEHTDKLGETEAEIAGEKAGIAKAGVPLILGTLRPEAERVIRDRALEVGAPIRAQGEAFEATRPTSAVPPLLEWNEQALLFRARAPADFEFEARLAMTGDPALANAALAVECVRALAVYPDDTVARAAQAALAKRRLPGRIEILKGDPEVVIDSAHTAESARALVSVLLQFAPEGYELLISVSADKNLAGVLGALLPAARRVWVTRAEPLRSLPPAELATLVRERAPSVAIEVIDDPEKATLRARESLAPGLRLCATGSIYLAGVARRVLRERIARGGPDAS